MFRKSFNGFYLFIILLYIYFCEEKQITRRMQVFQKQFMNIEIATNIEA